MIEFVLSLEFSRKLHLYHSYYWKWKSNSSFWNWSWLLRLYSIVRFSCQLYCSKLQQIWISLRSQPYLSAVQALAQNNFCNKKKAGNILQVTGNILLNRLGIFCKKLEIFCKQSRNILQTNWRYFANKLEIFANKPEIFCKKSSNVFVLM